MRPSRQTSREDRAAGEVGIAAEHPADIDLREAGGEVVQPGAELEEEGAHAEEAGGAGVYPVAGPCLHREADAVGQERTPAAWTVEMGVMPRVGVTCR